VEINSEPGIDEGRKASAVGCPTKVGASASPASQHVEVVNDEPHSSEDGDEDTEPDDTRSGRETLLDDRLLDGSTRHHCR
jgi:hypothetical protein